MAGDALTINPWTIDETEYPRAASIRDQLAFCVNYAVLAPSIHNTQPWLFRLLEDCVELYVDRSRHLPMTDPHGREQFISCGAALTNLLVAIQRFGHEGWVQYMPDPANADLVARVRVGRPRVPDHQELALFRSIRRRRTVRHAFQPRAVPRELQRRMIWLASEYGCWLYFAESESVRHQIASLVEDAQLRQLQDDEYQAERAKWVGIGQHPRSNGQSPSPFSTAMNGNGSVSTEVDSNGKHWLERDRELIKSSPVLFVLGTSGDSPNDWLRAGEALQRILLKAESEHVSASFLNQPCQIPELREELRLMTGRNGPPQMILRMGYGTGTEPPSRRPARDVILHDETV